MIAIAPFAAGLDWLETLLPVLFVGFWILSQLFAIGKKIVGPAAPREVRIPAPPIDPELQSEIREFLERKFSMTPFDRKPAAAVRERAKASTTRRESRPSGGPTITQKVREDFSKELAHLSTPLTERVGDARATVRDGSPSRKVSAAAGLAAMLRSPESMRQIILLREILDRPVGRW